jgi:hypothetical protein
VDWRSSDIQKRALACFHLDMESAIAFMKQVTLVSSLLAHFFEKLSVDAHDDFLSGRRPVEWYAQRQPVASPAASAITYGRAAAPVPRSVRLPRLAAPVVYPIGDPDALALDNSDLRRCAPQLRARARDEADEPLQAGAGRVSQRQLD